VITPASNNDLAKKTKKALNDQKRAENLTLLTSVATLIVLLVLVISLWLP